MQKIRDNTWKKIDVTTKHLVSKYGNILSLNYKHKDYAQVLTPSYGKDGYLIITISVDGKSKTHKVHRLVAKAFLQNPNNYTDVHHINENIYDNCLENLQWISPAKHTQEHCKLNADDVIEIFRLYNVDKWSQQRIADHFGICQTQVGRILRRKRWSNILIPIEYL